MSPHQAPHPPYAPPSLSPPIPFVPYCTPSHLCTPPSLASQSLRPLFLLFSEPSSQQAGPSSVSATMGFELCALLYIRTCQTEILKAPCSEAALVNESSRPLVSVLRHPNSTRQAGGITLLLTRHALSVYIR